MSSYSHHDLQHPSLGRAGPADGSRSACATSSPASRADVVGLNEVLHPVTTSARTYAPLAELAEHLGMWYAFGPSGWLDYGPSWQGPVGNAVLSRYPLARRRKRLAAAPAQHEAAFAALRDRFPAARLPGLTAFVTHLDHAFEGTRLFQIKGVLRRMTQRAHGHPHFLMGDFNTPGFLGPRSRQIPAAGASRPCTPPATAMHFGRSAKGTGARSPPIPRWCALISSSFPSDGRTDLQRGRDRRAEI